MLWAWAALRRSASCWRATVASDGAPGARGAAAGRLRVRIETLAQAQRTCGRGPACWSSAAPSRRAADDQLGSFARVRRRPAPAPGKRELLAYVHLSAADEHLRAMFEHGIEIEARDLPGSRGVRLMPNARSAWRLRSTSRIRGTHAGGRLVFVVHNHQPVGNSTVFEAAFERACGRSSPFSTPPGRAPDCISRPGVEWMEEHHPTICVWERWSELRPVELLGGGYYEPIPAAILERDRLGQLERSPLARTPLRVRPRRLIASASGVSLAATLVRRDRSLHSRRPHLPPACRRPSSTAMPRRTDSACCAPSIRRALRHPVPPASAAEALARARRGAASAALQPVFVLGDDGEVRFVGWHPPAPKTAGSTSSHAPGKRSRRRAGADAVGGRRQRATRGRAPPEAACRDDGVGPAARRTTGAAPGARLLGDRC